MMLGSKLMVRLLNAKDMHVFHMFMHSAVHAGLHIHVIVEITYTCSVLSLTGSSATFASVTHIMLI